MKKKLICASLLCLCSAAHALQVETVGDKPACLTKGLLDDLSRAAVSNDLGSVSALLNSGQCFFLKDGVLVTLTEGPGVFGTKAQIMLKGVKVWTVREGVRFP